MGGFKELKLCITLLCVSLLVTPLIQLPEAQAEVSNEVTQLLAFFRDVLRIDTSQCTVNVPFERGDNSPELGTRGQKEGKVVLTFNDGGSIDSLFEFRGKYLTWCLIYYDVGNTNPIPYLEHPSGDPLELAHGFLERYEQFTNDSTIGDMDNLLQKVKVVEPLSEIEGNLKLEISVRDEPNFYWSYTFEGEDYRLLSVGFFSPPHIVSFSDQRYTFNMNDSAFPSYEPLNSPNLPEPSISSPSPIERISSESNLSVQPVFQSSLSSTLGFSALFLAVAVGLGAFWFMGARRLKRRALID